MSRRILIVDDEESIRSSLGGILRDEGFEVVTSPSGEAALAALDAEDPDLVMLDVWLPGIDGVEALEAIKGRQPELPVIMMSGHGTIETAVKCAKIGAYDFFEKPLNLDKVLLGIENALKASRLAQENRYLRDQAGRTYTMVGTSAPMDELREQIRIVAATRASVLITGDNGTGKELVARAIHAGSKRSEGPFVEVNCAAIPEDLIESELFGHEKGAFTGAAARRRGKFDLADGGSLFLDEIGDMSLKTQAKILRVLQEMRFERVGGARTYEVDVRVIAATNKDLEEEIRNGRFREDLYFRLNVVPFHVPSLRERREDIPALVNHFIRLFCREEKRDPVAIDAAALAALQGHAWPGNVRELKNIAERMVILCRGEVITLEDVPAALRSTEALAAAIEPEVPGPGLRDARRAFERQFILSHLEGSGWNIPQAAERIGLDKSSLYKKLKELEIDVPAV
jgi:two-component system nitrogen regulation response regulator NtrX